MSKRTVAVFTGNRAEYGLQFPILRAIAQHPDLECRLIVSGAHLDPDFGKTMQEIEQDGFTIHDEVRIDLDEDTLHATAKAIGTGTVSMSAALDRLRPDVVVVYADRYEGFAAVIAATQMGLPTAHIEGGDVTEGGALDDSVRHAMTKLSHLHFTTNQEASNRIIAMGEEPWRVKTVGFPGIDMIVANELATPAEVRDRLDLDLDRPIVLFTQHSVATEFDAAAAQVEPALAALRELASEGVQIIATYPSSDAGGKRIIAALEAFAAEGLPNVTVRKSLGRYLYYGVLSLAKDQQHRVVCASNSSSGIKETPAFGCPAVNIGSRQDGRLRADNVIDVGYDAAALQEAVRMCLFDDAFRERCATCENPYGTGDAGIKVAEAIARVPLDEKLLRKRMTLRGELNDGWYR